MRRAARSPKLGFVQILGAAELKLSSMQGLLQGRTTSHARAVAPALPSPLGGAYWAPPRACRLIEQAAVRKRSAGWVGGGDTVRGVEMGMRRRGAAAAIMARTKEGLGSEVPSPPSCTNSLAAAAPSTYGVWEL